MTGPKPPKKEEYIKKDFKKTPEKLEKVKDKLSKPEKKK